MRNQLNLSQQKVADALLITRGRYAKYEDGASEPPIELLLKLSRYFHVSIDLLLSVDLRRISLKQIMELPDNRIILPITIDNQGENKIEIVPHKASMGYLDGYSDPEYIESLQTITLPFLKAGKYRAFPVEGDSMPPHKEGSYIIGKYVERISDLKKGKGYVFITRGEGMTYKKLEGIEVDFLAVRADNVFYDPYKIKLTDIVELWEYACSIATKEFTEEDLNTDNQIIISSLKRLEKEVREIKITMM